MKRRLIIIALIVAAVGMAAGGIAWYVRRNSGLRLLARAEVALRADNLEQAAELSRRHIEQYPEDWRGYQFLAEACLRRGEYDQVRKVLNQRFALRPTEFAILLSRTYTHPALKSLGEYASGRRDDRTADRLEQAAKGFEQANLELLKGLPADAAGELRVREAEGMNLMYAGGARQYLADWLKREAETADTVGDRDKAQKRRDLAAEALAAAQKSRHAAVEALLGVVRADPGKAVAAESLVRTCLALSGAGGVPEEMMAAVRAAIWKAPESAPAAAAELALWELEPNRRRKAAILETRTRLEGLRLKGEPPVEFRLARARLSLLLAQCDMPDRSDLAAGLRACEEVLKTLPRHPEARLLRASILIGQGQAALAEQDLFRLKTEEPGWPQAHFAYAQAALASGKAELARQAMRRVTELDPGHAGARRYLAASLMGQGYYKEAYTDALAYYQAHPDDEDALRLYVEACRQTERTELALANLRQAVEQGASNPGILKVVAQGYRSLGLEAEAHGVLSKAAALQPGDAEARLLQVEALLLGNRTSEAEAILRETAASDPQSARAQWNLARLYAHLGRHAQALEHYRRAVQIDGQSLPCRLDLAKALFSGGYLDECLTHCQEALRQEPGNSLALLLSSQMRMARGEEPDPATLQALRADRRGGLPLAQAYFEHGQPQECVNLCLAELKKPSPDPLAILLLGDAYMALNQGDKALEQWSRLLSIWPDNQSVYSRLAAALWRQSPNADVAARLARLPGARDHLVKFAAADLLMRAGQARAAAELFAAVAAHSEASDYVRGQARLARAQVLFQDGEAAAAEAELDALLATRGWRDRALLAKAAVLGRRAGPAQAKPLLAEARQSAMARKDAIMLTSVAESCIRLGLVPEALAACDDLQQLLPQDAKPHLVRAATLVAAGRVAEAVASYQKAIELQPGDVSPHLMLARLLDMEGRPVEALAALDRLKDLGEAAGTAALMNRAGLLASWGLQPQAVECLETLLRQGHSDNPAVQFMLGQAFAKLGSAEQARPLLKAVPVHARQYPMAQQVLANLAASPQAAVDILSGLQKLRPGEPSVLSQIMLTLVRAGRDGDAVAAFVAFCEKPEHRPAPAAGYVAIEAALKVGKPESIQRVCDLARERIAGPRCRQAVALAQAEASTELAQKMAAAWQGKEENPVDALVGLCVAVRKGGPEAGKPWLTRLEQMTKAPAPDRPARAIPPALKMLANAAAGQFDQAKQALSEFGPQDAGRTLAEMFLAGAAKDPGAAANAADLLASALAHDLGLPTLARQCALRVLRRQGSCQLAAMLATRGADTGTLRTVGELLSPPNCTLARMTQAMLRMHENRADQAIPLLRQVVEAEPENEEALLSLGIAQEQAGQLADALESYRRAWQTSRSIVAANNAAYLICHLHPTDQARLAEAKAWIGEAVKANPQAPAFRDTSGWLAHLLGKQTEAYAELQQAARGLSESPEVQYHLGVLEASLGHAELARWRLAAAVNLGERMVAGGQPLAVPVARSVQAARERLASLGAAPPSTTTRAAPK